MNMGNLPLVGLLQQKMSWLSDRQSVLAANIANASTPGYVPHDLRANDFASALTDSMRGGMLTTNAMHIQPKAGEGRSYQAMVSPDSRSTPDGNSVVVEEQMLKVSETQFGYAQAAGLYKKMSSMWRTALGGSQ